MTAGYKLGLGWLWLLVGLTGVGWAQGLPRGSAQSVGMREGPLQRIESTIDAAIARKELPGAVVVVGHQGRIVFHRAFGRRNLLQSEPMTEDTVFDLASLTKPVATAPCIMRLVEQGRVRLDDPLGKFLPELEDPLARTVTLEQLLTHVSGFAGGLDRTRPWQGRSGARAELAHERLLHPPGTHFEYSDINYIALGLVIEQVSGLSLDEVARRELFMPLGMKSTTWCPGPEIGPIAPTQMRGTELLRGSVHDHVCARMGGIAGNAGLFATAEDLARFCQMMLNRGQLDGVRVLQADTIDTMVHPVVVGEAGQTRGLGWDIDTSYSSNRGHGFPKGSYGHTGFTGTSLWIDPVSQTFVIILTNRVHPDGRGKVVALRTALADLVAESVADEAAWKRASAAYQSQVEAQLPLFQERQRELAGGPVHPRPAYRVLNGIDILQEDRFAQLQGYRVGLVTNHSGRNRQGTSTIDLLAHAPGLQLVRLFSPEHGLRGRLDEAVSDDRDAATGLPVVSLYGPRQRPRPEDLQGLTALVFDIQDCGTRFYTYLSTLRYVLEAAAQAHIPVYLLDRPNPLGGEVVEGPLPDPGNLSFTCPHPIPVRHGMTFGELATMMNAEDKLGADLHVVRMDPWSRSLAFDQTGQTWINPSPNLRCLDAAWLYPGIGWLEFTNLSVGRGTDRPFQQLGAPWIQARRLATLVNARNLPGVRLMPTEFTPTSSHYAGQTCPGVQIIITDREAVRPVRLGLELAWALTRLHPGEFEIQNLNKLLVNQDTVNGLRAGRTPPQLESSWSQAEERFRARRQPYLLY